MVEETPRLEVLPGTSALAPRAARSQLLLDELAAALHLPQDVTLQLALTNALGALQASGALFVTLAREPSGDHKRGSEGV